jgi:phage FluMu protein Com
MFVQIKCSFCDQAFDFDSSSGILMADCPHCGKQNTVAAPAGAAPELSIQRDAPNLSGAKTCPSCKAQVARDAVLCVNCGFNLKTGRKAGGDGWFAANKNLVLLLGGGLIALALGLGYLLWPETEAPPPPFVPTAESAAAKSAKPAVEPPAPATPAEPAVATNAVAETNAPPPPTKEELAAQKAEAKRLALEAEAEAKRLALEAQAEAERAAFEAKKFEAEQNLRLQLDTQAPLYQTNENVELRRKNGVVDKGTLTSFSGTGTGRVVLVATPVGEIGVPLILMDTPSRLRLDPEYREAYIQHRMSTLPAPAAPVEQPKK